MLQVYFEFEKMQLYQEWNFLRKVKNFMFILLTVTSILIEQLFLIEQWSERSPLKHGVVGLNLQKPQIFSSIVVISSQFLKKNFMFWLLAEWSSKDRAPLQNCTICFTRVWLRQSIFYAPYCKLQFCNWLRTQIRIWMWTQRRRTWGVPG